MSLMHLLRPLATRALASLFRTSLPVRGITAGSPRRLGGMGILGSFVLLLAALGFAPAASAATGTCGAATSQGTNGPSDYATYCWFDFTGYNNTTATSPAGQAFVITLTGGSTLSFTLKVSGPALTATTVPTWTGAAMGQSAFIGIPGSPALYQTTGAGTTNVTLSNIVLTVGTGTVPYAIVAADAESTNNGESLSFTTNGNVWSLLASMQYNATTTTFPTLTGTGTATVTETGVAGNVGAYAFATTGSPTTISSSMTGTGLQGIAFAVKFHAVDFAIASAHTGNFNLGSTDAYTLTVTSNGPDQYTPTDTVTVTDTIPTGMSYVSASGSGWTCGDVGQLVTCTATNVTVNSGSSLPAITLNVSVGYTTATTLTNTATVASNPNLDFNTANNTATDPTTLVDPDLSNSTKTVLNPSGGDYSPGGTVQYTITLTESGGVNAINASVTDDVPANLTGLTIVSFPSGATNSSTTTGGANGNGQVNITGITVPANSSVTVVFTVQVAGGTAACTAINNTATVTNPYGNGATPGAPTITVSQSSCTASGSKILYLWDGTTGQSYNNLLNRVKQTQNSSAGGVDTINGGGGTMTWSLSPTIVATASAPTGLILKAGTVTVTLVETATGSNTGNTRSTTVTLLNNGASVGVSAAQNVANGAAVYTYTITLASAVTVAPGKALGIMLTNNVGSTNRTIAVSQMTAAQGRSTVSFATSTVINVDSVTAYNSTYTGTGTPGTTSVYAPSQTGKTVTVFICAVISDPFGSYDVDPATGGVAPKITLTAPNGAVPVTNATMTLNNSTAGGKDCSGTANAGLNSYEYTYNLPTTGLGSTGGITTTGFWTATVTGQEGTETAPAITQTSNGSFDVDVPALLVMKTVSVMSSTQKATPGQQVLYTITVQNNGRGAADAASLVITDPIPNTNTGFYLSAATPFTFTDGSTASGLSAPVMTFSTNGGTSFAYSPGCTRPCTDTTINDIKITFTGAMNGKTGATAPSFTISFQVTIQ